MTPRLRTAYWGDPTARRSFKDFILRIHGVDFSLWESAGYWDDDYSPYSWFEGDRLVASLCIYTMPAVVKGERCRVAQVSGVGTLPEYRLRGLNRRLHEMALAEALRDHRFAFLFADEEAVPFYRKCGFRPVTAHAVVVPMPRVTPDPGIEKVDVNDPREREGLYALARTRSPLSREFATLNPKLVMYHVLYRLREHVCRIPALDAVVLMKRDRERTVVYDVLARDLPRFDRLAPFLSGGGTEVEFRFPVDGLHAPPGTLRPLAGHNVHVMGDFDLGPQPVFPFTSQA